MNTTLKVLGIVILVPVALLTWGVYIAIVRLNHDVIEANKLTK